MNAEEYNKKQLSFDAMLNEAVALQKKIDAAMKFIEEHNEELNEEQEIMLDKIKKDMGDTIPELDKLYELTKYLKN